MSLSGFIARHIEQPALAPLEARLAEDPVQALGLGRARHLHRPRDGQRAHVRRDLVPLDAPRDLPEIREAPVRAAADERPR